MSLGVLRQACAVNGVVKQGVAHVVPLLEVDAILEDPDRDLVGQRKEQIAQTPEKRRPSEGVLDAGRRSLPTT